MNKSSLKIRGFKVINHRYSLIAVAVASALLAYQPASAQSLKEAVEQTIKTNPDVLIEADRRLQTDQTLRQANAGYLPKVDLGLGIGTEFSDNITTRKTKPPHIGEHDWRSMGRTESSLTLTQMLYDGSATYSEVQRQTARQESAAFKVAGSSEQVGLRAVEAYLEVLRRQAELGLIQENLAATERIYGQIKIRATSGVGRKADQEQAEARLALSQANVESAQANLREALITYKRIVGIAPADLTKPGEPEGVPADADGAVQTALANHPIIKSAQADIDATKAQTKAAESKLKPRFDLQLGTDWNNNQDGVQYHDNDAYAMVRMQYNLYHGGADQARISETKLQTLEAQEVLSRTKRQVEESTSLSWNALQTAIDRLPKLKSYADSTEQTRDAYAKQFSIGQRTLLDLLDSENELYTARNDYVDAQYVELFAHYRLLADIGRLIETLGVTPREEATPGEKNQMAGYDTAAVSPSAAKQEEMPAVEPEPDAVVEPVPEGQPAQ